MHLYQSLFGDSTSDFDAGKDIIKHIHGHLDYNEISKYYDVNSYSSLGSTGYLRIVHMNAQGLTKSKIQSIIALNETLKYIPDILCFTETWFTPLDSQLHEIQGYSSYHIIRDQRAHGGVSIYVKNSIKSNQIEKLSFISGQIEINTIQVVFNNSKYTVCAIYRPKFKHDDVEIFSEELEKIINGKAIK